MADLLDDYSRIRLKDLGFNPDGTRIAEEAAKAKKIPTYLQKQSGAGGEAGRHCCRNHWL